MPLEKPVQFLDNIMDCDSHYTTNSSQGKQNIFDQKEEQMIQRIDAIVPEIDGESDYMSDDENMPYQRGTFSNNALHHQLSQYTQKKPNLLNLEV